MQPFIPVQPPNTQILFINDKLPIFRRDQPVFNKELADERKDEVVNLGPAEFEHEGRERHIVDAVFSKKQIPTKKIEVDQAYVKPQGLMPKSSYSIYNLAAPPANILYDLCDVDYDFLEQNPDLTEHQLQVLITILDVMFPTRYRNINPGTEGHTYSQINQAVAHIAANPRAFQICSDQLKYEQDQLRNVFLHFCRQRDKTRQPLMLHMSADHTHRDKKDYFKLEEKKARFNAQKSRQYLNLCLLQNMLGEYVVARELLGCYQIPTKYFEALQQFGTEHQPFRPLHQKSLLDQIEHYEHLHHQVLPNPTINPVYNVMIPFKPYLSAEQLKGRHEQTLNRSKEPFAPQEGARVAVEKTKREANDFVEFANEVEDGTE